MGQGIDIARAAGAGAHADLLEDLRDQLLIVLLKRLGGSVDIPVGEIDATGQDLMYMAVDANSIFHFELRKKS